MIVEFFDTIEYFVILHKLAVQSMIQTDQPPNQLAKWHNLTPKRPHPVPIIGS
jgi:hypothetical protein